MIDSIVYINYQPLTEKVKRDFYFDLVVERGYFIEYWDLTNIYFPNILQDHLSEECIIRFNSYAEIENAIAGKQNDRSLYVLMVSYESRVLKLFSLLTKYHCKTSFFARGAIPSQAGNIKSMMIKISKALRPTLLFSFFENKYASIQKKQGKIKYHDFIFNAGEFGFQFIGYGYQIDRAKATIIPLNSFDYDRYISASGCSNLLEHRYCLFLDEYLPFHPDFHLLGIETIEPTSYYKELNRCFDLIEKKYNVEVVIAAHPKAEKYRTNNYFNGRRIFFDKTAELTKYAEFTLAHASTSISFTVLEKKPIYFLFCDQIKSKMPTIFHLILSFSASLEGALVNMSDLYSEMTPLNPVNHAKYIDYKYKYLTSKDSERRISADIFCDFISKL